MAPDEFRQPTEDDYGLQVEYIDDPVPKDELIVVEQSGDGAGDGSDRSPPDGAGGGVEFIGDPVPRSELFRDMDKPMRFVLSLLLLVVLFSIFLVALLTQGLPTAKEVWLLLSPVVFLVLGYYFGGRRRNQN